MASLLYDFDINKILDDMTYQVGDPALLVFLESYGNFTHFNVGACERLEGIGYAKSTALTGLAVYGQPRTVPDTIEH